MRIELDVDLNDGTKCEGCPMLQIVESSVRGFLTCALESPMEFDVRGQYESFPGDVVRPDECIRSFGE